jgi:hypothetical protein
MNYAVQHPVGGDTLGAILERVLEKGIVVAGDITVSLVGIELLSIKIRLLVATVDKAIELGINWWEADPMLTSQAASLEEENKDLRHRVALLQGRVARLKPRRRRRRPANQPAS